MKLLYKNSSLVEESTIKEGEVKLQPYVAHLKEVAEKNNYDSWDGTINLPFDADLLSVASKLKDEKVASSLKYIIVVGIGGSSLGTRAIYSALVGHFDFLERDRSPKMIFADTNNPKILQKLTKLIDDEISRPEEVIVNVVTKSGGTTEVIVNIEVIMEALKNKFGDEAKERLVITTNFDSVLWKEGDTQGIARLGIPEKVGGKFSVLSAVGLFPLLCLGIDTKELRRGAANIREQCLGESVDTNPAMLSAIILFHHYQNKIVISDNFVFHTELESLGKWYRQLMSESTSKDGIGMTPTVSVGSTDLHSVEQLYLGGPKNKIITFIYSEKFLEGINIPQERMFPNLVEAVSGKSADKVMSAILKGVKECYLKNKLPFMEVVLPDISEYSLGEFLQFKMMEIMYLGNLMGVNVFDQPQVESYKVETKKFLEKD